MDVVVLTTADTYPLRRRVLREDSPDPAAVMIPGDEEPTTVHLGVHDDDGHLIAVSTWVWRPAPDGTAPAVQLRAMAVDPTLQGTGLGAVLLSDGVDRSFLAGAAVVWANARDSALGFYTGHDFTVVGAGFVDAMTGLAHHVVVRAAG